MEHCGCTSHYGQIKIEAQFGERLQYAAASECAQVGHVVQDSVSQSGEGAETSQGLLSVVNCPLSAVASRNPHSSHDRHDSQGTGAVGVQPVSPIWARYYDYS